MTTENFRGTLTPLVTPFNENDGSIDFKSLENLISYQLEAGVDGIVACGSTAEAASLMDDEYLQVVKFCTEKTRGKVPCIAGIGLSNSKKACELAKALAEVRVDGLLLVSPPYVKPTQEGILQHFRSVKSACGLPIVAYNIPGRTASMIAPETIAKLASEKIICAVKDSTGSLENVIKVYMLTEGKINILSGEDLLVSAIMSSGGMGVISASANLLPREFLEITNSALNGNFKGALAAQTRIQKTIEALFSETNPIPLKYALKKKGIIKSDFVRIPLTKASKLTREKIDCIIN